MHATVQLQLPADAFVLTVHDERLDAARGSGPADAVLAGSVRTIQDLVFDRRPLDDALRSGDARIDGNTALLTPFLATFDDHRTRRRRATGPTP